MCLVQDPSQGLSADLLCAGPGGLAPVLRDLSYHFLTLGFPAMFYTRASLNPVYKKVVVLGGETHQR